MHQFLVKWKLLDTTFKYIKCTAGPADGPTLLYHCVMTVESEAIFQTTCQSTCWDLPAAVWM